MPSQARPEVQPNSFSPTPRVSFPPARKIVSPENFSRAHIRGDQAISPRNHFNTLPHPHINYLRLYAHLGIFTHMSRIPRSLDDPHDPLPPESRPGASSQAISTGSAAAQTARHSSPNSPHNPPEHHASAQFAAQIDTGAKHPAK